MASGPITSWEIDGETKETVRDFIFLGSKITADAECSHEIKRHLLLGRKAMTNLHNVLKAGTLLLISVFVLCVYSIAAYTARKQHQGFSRLYIAVFRAKIGEDDRCCFQGVLACISLFVGYCSDMMNNIKNRIFISKI